MALCYPMRDMQWRQLYSSEEFACSQPVPQSPLRHIIEYPPAGTHSHLVAIVISLPSSSPCRWWNLPRNKTYTSSPGWYHSASNNYRLVQRQHLTLLQSSKEGQLHKETAPFEELLLYLLDKAWLHSVYEILSAVPISRFPHCSWWLDQNILHRGWLCIKSRPIFFKEMCGSVIVNQYSFSLHVLVTSCMDSLPKMGKPLLFKYIQISRLASDYCPNLSQVDLLPCDRLCEATIPPTWPMLSAYTTLNHSILLTYASGQPRSVYMHSLGPNSSTAWPLETALVVFITI